MSVTSVKPAAPPKAPALSVAIMGHPSRQHFIDGLQRELPTAELVLDRNNDRWETGRRSLLAFDPAATHHLCVQDDAILCKDFLAGAALVAQAAGEHPVSLYTGKVRPHQHTITPAVTEARRRGIPWIEAPGPYWGVALIIPTAHIPELVRWADEQRAIRNYDRRIEAWYTDQQIDCWYTIPSLADHRPVDENPSLVRGRDGNRRAHYFIREGRSPLAIDWNLPPLGIREIEQQAIKDLRVQLERAQRRIVVLEGRLERARRRPPVRQA